MADMEQINVFYLTFCILLLSLYPAPPTQARDAQPLNRWAAPREGEAPGGGRDRLAGGFGGPRDSMAVRADQDGPTRAEELTLYF